MANRAEHDQYGRMAGGVAAALACLASSHQAKPLEVLAELLGGVLGGQFGSQLPDIFEPPTSSWHRGSLHSVATTCAVSYAGVAHVAGAAEALRASALADLETGDEGAELRALLKHLLAGLLVGLPAGYVSHTLADAGTARSIPLLVRGF